MAFYKFSRMIPALLAFGMVACMDDNDTGTNVGSGPIDYSYSRTEKLVVLEDGQYMSISEYADCDGAKAVSEADTSNYSYEFSNDQLIITGEYSSCKSIFTGGKSNSLSGTWTMVDSKPTSENMDTDECEIETDATRKTTFNGTSIVNSVVVKGLCWADEEISYYEEDLPSDVTVAKSGCNTIKATDVAGNVASRTLVSFDATSFTTKWSYAYNGKSCTRVKKDELATDKVCAEAFAAYQEEGSNGSFYWDEWTSDGAQKEFEACMETLDVSDDLDSFL